MIRNLIAIFLSIFFTSGDAMAQGNAYDFSFTNNDGSILPLRSFSGKVLLIVNTASKCGFTEQYKDLEQLWLTYKDKGLVIIAVPANDFGNQEPGSDAEIKQFCETHFKITFPIVSKETVIGENAHPFYKWAAQESGFFGVPKWNFHKYLIDKNGNFVDYYFSQTSPSSKKVVDAIEAELAK
jgi:glutathione peroxidase